MSRNWSEDEVRAVVDDYFEMLVYELTGVEYNKTKHRNKLKKKLDNRSDGSIEWKHQNISAVLSESSFPFIAGYKPRHNYQGLLRDITHDYLDTQNKFVELVERSVNQSADKCHVGDILSRMVSVPSGRLINSSSVEESKYTRLFGYNYLEQEAKNISLGSAGEMFVIDYEKARLCSLDRDNLAERIEHIPSTRGDGVGFDVLSFESNGKDRYIEVKTTRYGIYTPFYLTRNEVVFSRENNNSYHLYRVFDYQREPKIYSLNGDVKKRCKLDPVLFVADVSE
jgi:hypothetical protein